MSLIPLRSSDRNGSASLAVLELISPAEAIISKPPSRAAVMVIWMVASLIVALVATMALLPVDRVVTAEGRVVPLSSTILIQPLETSLIRSFYVHANQVVHAGDLIARLDSTFSNADLTTLEFQTANQQAEVERLEAELTGKRYEAEGDRFRAAQAVIFDQREAERHFRVQNFEQRMTRLSETAQRSEAEAHQLELRLAVAARIELMRQELERAQVGSRLSALVAADSRLEIQRALGVAQGQARETMTDLAAVKSEREAYLSQWRAQVAQDLAERRRVLNESRENLAKARLRNQLVELRAPQDAVVLELGKTSVGAVLGAGELLVSLVPLDAPLEIDAQLQPRDIGHVSVGDQVQIKFESYPYIQHGTAKGTVRNIGADTTRNQGKSSTSGERPFYLARISLDDVHLRNLPPDFRIVPGMPVEADIVVGNRTVVDYLLQNIAKPVTEGMREP